MQAFFLHRYLIAKQILEELSKCAVEFVFDDQKSIETLIEFNETAFARSKWALKGEELKRRNVSFIKRYKYSFMLIREPIFDKEYMGFTCMLPLTYEGADAYRNKAHGDLDMPDWFIAPYDERPEAILIFSIALIEKFSFTKQGKGAVRQYSEYFINCIWCHLNTVRMPWFGIGYKPRIWAQTEEPALERRLRRAGFTGTGNITKDGLEILEYKDY